MKKQQLYILIGIGTFLIIGWMVLVNSPKISNEISRAYWNFRRYGVGPGISVQNFAGCQSRVAIETRTDEQFSIMWEEESVREHFDAIDVDRYMMKYCPPSMSEEVRAGYEKYYKSYNERMRKSNQLEISQEEQKKEIERAIQKEIVVSAYQKKFLNREFTALKDEPKE